MAHSKDRYLPLHHDVIDTWSSFETQEDVDSLVSDFGKSQRSDTKLVAIVVLVIVATIESLFLFKLRFRDQRECLLTPSLKAFLGDFMVVIDIVTVGRSRARTVNRELYGRSPFTSYNETEASLAWENILPGHGVVALGGKYIAEHSLPPSMKYPEDKTKEVYILEAYHAIHCIKVLRRHYRALDDGIPGSWSREHDMHCFDGLRQYVMCNPDDTLLNTTGHRDAGHHMTKKCEDWDDLRDWAKERSAHYFDREPGGKKNLWFGDDDGDGLPIGSLS